MRLKAVFRVVIFTPPEFIHELLAAVTTVADLANGPYQDVAWWSAEAGTEQFRPVVGSSPTLGSLDKITRAPSARLEFSISRDKDLLERLISAAVEVHPWEQPVLLVAEMMELDCQDEEGRI